MNILHTVLSAIKTAASKVDAAIPGSWRSRISVVLALVIAVASVYAQSTLTIRTATITDGENVRVVTTLNSDPEAVLEEAGLSVSPDDEITHEIDQENLTIEITRAFDLEINDGGETVTVSVAGGTVADVLAAANITLNEEDSVNLDLDETVTEDTELEITRTVYREYKQTEKVKFDTKNVYTKKLRVGKTKVKTEGVDGRKTVTYREKLVNGEVVDTQVVEETIIKKPTTQVQQVGTNSTIALSEAKKSIKLDKKGQPVKFKKVLTGKCTAYSSEQSTVGTTTSTGMKAQVGVVAVNPKVIPYGTKLYIVSPDGKTVYGYAVAGDTGGGARKNEIVCDLYMDTIAECIQFGRRTMNVYILE